MLGVVVTIKCISATATMTQSLKQSRSLIKTRSLLESFQMLNFLYLGTRIIDLLKEKYENNQSINQSIFI